MSQIFHPSVNILVRLALLGLGLLLAGLAGLGYLLTTAAPLMTGVGVAQTLPVPYSHELHVGGLGLDCRYCHSGVEDSAFAGIPPLESCLGCHTQVATDSVALEPVRAGFANAQPLEWIRVHNLADYVYFNHSIHINKGVGCETCHGRIDQTPVVAKTETLQMAWCLECHRAPERFIRPQEEVITMGWQPPVDQATLGPQLVAEYGLKVEQLTDCSVCHR
jgi:hypothetical protein